MVFYQHFVLLMLLDVMILQLTLLHEYLVLNILHDHCHFHHQLIHHTYSCVEKGADNDTKKQKNTKQQKEAVVALTPATQTKQQTDHSPVFNKFQKQEHTRQCKTYKILSQNPNFINISHICTFVPNKPIDFTFKFDKSSLKFIIDDKLRLPFGHKKFIKRSMFSGGNNDLETVPLIHKTHKQINKRQN